MRAIVIGTALAAVGMAASAQRIYSCVDAQGRRITSDRPIMACLDREQKEHNPSGTVRKVVPPSLTASERAEIEARERKAIEEKQRSEEDRRRERALLGRYPNQAAHDAERTKALAAVQEVIDAALKRTEDLRQQRAELAKEAEEYRADPSKMPPKLRRQLDENAQMMEGQARFLTHQEEEKRRINAQFDQELARLKALWAQQGRGAAAARQ